MKTKTKPVSYLFFTKRRQRAIVLFFACRSCAHCRARSSSPASLSRSRVARDDALCLRTRARDAVAAPVCGGDEMISDAIVVTDVVAGAPSPRRPTPTTPLFSVVLVLFLRRRRHRLLQQRQQQPGPLATEQQQQQKLPKSNTATTAAKPRPAAPARRGRGPHRRSPPGPRRPPVPPRPAAADAPGRRRVRRRRRNDVFVPARPARALRGRGRGRRRRDGPRRAAGRASVRARALCILAMIALARVRRH